MPQRIDVMTLQIAECPNFVVNTAVDSVTLNIPAGTNRFVTYSTGKFTKGDSFQLLSAGLVFPESFTFFRKLLNDALPSMRIVCVGAVSAAQYTNPNFTIQNVLFPMENYETVFDTFYDCVLSYRGGNPLLNLLLEDFYITGNMLPCEISMQGVTAAFNGKTFYIAPFIKVLHTIALS
jgi:hypothetical protein